MSFFRMASIVLILTAGIHLIGHFQGFKPDDEKQEQLYNLMQTVELKAGSDSVTMMNLVLGFSLCFALFFLWTGVSALFISIRAHDNVRLIKSYALICTFMLAIGTYISYSYFFFAPTTCFMLALILFAVSYFRIKTT